MTTARGNYTRCLAIGCRKKAVTRGVCKGHYNKWHNLKDRGEKPSDRLEDISNPTEISGYSPGRPQDPVGSRKVHKNGYVQVKVGIDHMLARDDRRSGTWVLEHRKIMAEKLGRPLKRTEIVKHKDNDITNNSPSNLYIMGDSDGT